MFDLRDGRSQPDRLYKTSQNKVAEREIIYVQDSQKVLKRICLENHTQ